MVPKAPSTGSGGMPTVSIVIPTWNAAGVLDACLASVGDGGLPDVEVIVVDSRSEDGTPTIARARGARVISETCGATKGRLLGARAAAGTFVLNLDADHRVLPGALRRALATGADVVGFGERCDGAGLVARANRLQNGASVRDWRSGMVPIGGTLAPRWYRRSLLVHALERIPRDVLETRPSPYAEDFLVFYEASRESPSLGFVPEGLAHEELASTVRYMRKWFRYGATAKAYRGTEYEAFFRARARRRLRGAFQGASLPAIALRSPGFWLGYWL